MSYVTYVLYHVCALYSICDICYVHMTAYAYITHISHISHICSMRYALLYGLQVCVRRVCVWRVASGIAHHSAFRLNNSDSDQRRCAISDDPRAIG
jgi:hypothetical protein